MDDILIKNRTSKTHILEETFAILRKYKMKLNPTKHAFGVKSDRFLGFMLSNWGIEANPAKIWTI